MSEKNCRPIPHSTASKLSGAATDPKLALAGEIESFTGVSDPYEEPESPEIVVDTEAQTPEESAQIVVQKLEELGLIGSEVRA